MDSCSRVSLRKVCQDLQGAKINHQENSVSPRKGAALISLLSSIIGWAAPRNWKFPGCTPRSGPGGGSWSTTPPVVEVRKACSHGLHTFLWRRSNLSPQESPPRATCSPPLRGAIQSPPHTSVLTLLPTFQPHPPETREQTPPIPCI